MSDEYRLTEATVTTYSDSGPAVTVTGCAAAMVIAIRRRRRHQFQQECQDLADLLDRETSGHWSPEVRHIVAALREAFDLKCAACGRTCDWTASAHQRYRDDTVSARHLELGGNRGTCTACNR